jgi:hypothetical protein
MKSPRHLGVLWWGCLIWTTVAFGGIVLSFFWNPWWSNSDCSYCIHIEHGVFYGYPDMPIPPGTACAPRPSYGRFELVRQSWVYMPWRLSPLFDGDYFRIPIHISFVLTTPILIYPLLPAVKRRKRRKLGLCPICEYDLRGNESGICPECGTPADLPPRTAE